VLAFAVVSTAACEQARPTASVTTATVPASSGAQVIAASSERPHDDAGAPSVVASPDAALGGSHGKALPRVFEVRNASAQYDFRISLRRACAPPPELEGSDICEAPGSVAVFPKGSAAELQRVDLESIDVVAGDDGQPVLVNEAPLYDSQGTLDVGDFNFDGHDDFAVQDSQSGSYGGPTFVVFLYDARLERFVRSAGLTGLTRTHLGFFQVDSKRRRLVALSKDGCCFHVTDEYAVVHDAPVLVDSVTEDATGDDIVVTTHRRLVHGKWITSTMKTPWEAER
jgi:hypothetical protein